MRTFDSNFHNSFNHLFTHEGLLALDGHFTDFLKHQDPLLLDQLLLYRTQEATQEKTQEATNDKFSPTQTSEFIIQLAQYLEIFLINYFTIVPEYQQLKAQVLANNPIGLFKKNFVLTKVKKKIAQLADPEKRAQAGNFSELYSWLLAELNQHANNNTHNNNTQDLELAIAHYYLTLNNAIDNTEQLEKLSSWCALAYLTPEGQAIIHNWYSFKLPSKTDFNQLVNTNLTEDKLKLRDGFELTDQRLDSRSVQTEIHYCIYCHDHDGDLCSKGFPENKKLRDNKFKKNPLGSILTGCPLEEKISEMHWLKREGLSLAALAVVMIDNPMCPATGHRICNDCMKSCIYQKLTPVNIPEIETRVLTDILELPWGVEIYDLLTRWNPLKPTQWLTKPYNHKKIMIAGLGPAGFTLAHYLLQEGCAVVGFDGLKIEALPEQYLKQPIKHYAQLRESLDERVITGFGGVAEYGITVRWDKNFLKLIYLSLARRPYFQAFGNMRFGGTIRVEDAWELGFDHFSIAVGAGLPKALPVKNSMAPGMRQANDFLMALQLTGAAKKNSLASLQIRLPAIIIGGGLTGVDAATEAQAYYIRQIEKLAEKYTALQQKAIPLDLDPESEAILQEFLAHAELVKQERALAQQEQRPANFIKLIRAWGGVSIAYRKTIQASPAYINNHEELQKALEEGVIYRENLQPTEIILDHYGACKAIKFSVTDKPDTSIELPAKSILVATGASLNVAYAFEHPETFERVKLQYQNFEADNITKQLVMPEASAHCKSKNFGPFTSYQKDDYRVSFIGDTHPVFHGNVVKAIASAKATYPKIMAQLNTQDNPVNSKPNDNQYQQFKHKIDQQFDSTVIAVNTIKSSEPAVLTLTVHAPQLIKHYKPGQFYRAQPFELNSKIIANHSTMAEAIMLFASDINKTQQQITFTVIQNTASSKLFRFIKPGDKLALMGPSGVRSKVSEHHETVLIIGNELGLVQLQSYGQALKQANNRVIFLGYFADKTRIFEQEKIEALADLVIWTVQSDQPHHSIQPIQPDQHISLTGLDCLQALAQYAKNQLPTNIAFSEIDRIQILGDANLLKQISLLFHQELKEQLVKHPKLFGSVHTPMQCMLKGVCAQCLQWQIDPETGERKKAVFACSWHDQPLELIDFDNLADRQNQSKLSEAINSAFIDEFMQHE